MSQENVQAMRGLYEAFNRGDLDALERGFSARMVWNEPENSVYAGGNPYRNFADIRDGVFAPIDREFEDFRCDVEQFYDAGDTVVTTGRFRGRHRGTGKELASQFCHVLQVDGDGRLERVEQFTDTLQEAEVHGLAQRVESPQIREPMPM